MPGKYNQKKHIQQLGHHWVINVFQNNAVCKLTCVNIYFCKWISSQCTGVARKIADVVLVHCL